MSAFYQCVISSSSFKSEVSICSHFQQLQKVVDESRRILWKERRIILYADIIPTVNMNIENVLP